jgi:hypothetical protein
MASRHGDQDASLSRGPLSYAANKYSQNGEDGIIARVFAVIGPGRKVCCEYGAWDGIHLSNTRALVEDGWRAALIERDERRFEQLKVNTTEFPGVVAINARIDSEANRLSEVLARAGFPRDLDLLSIDVDGLDYDLFLALDDIRPRVVCVEVNAGHSPNCTETVPPNVAAQNVGQPLSLFASAANQMGYRLICYTGNALFLSKDEGREREFPTLTPEQAYTDFLKAMPPSERRWLYLVNRGLVSPHYCFQNSVLTSSAFELPLIEIARARAWYLVVTCRHLALKPLRAPLRVLRRRSSA